MKINSLVLVVGCLLVTAVNGVGQDGATVTTPLSQTELSRLRVKTVSLVRLLFGRSVRDGELSIRPVAKGKIISVQHRYASLLFDRDLSFRSAMSSEFVNRTKSSGDETRNSTRVPTESKQVWIDRSKSLAKRIWSNLSFSNERVVLHGLKRSKAPQGSTSLSQTADVRFTATSDSGQSRQVAFIFDRTTGACLTAEITRPTPIRS